MSSLQVALVRKSAEEPGSAAVRRFKEKQTKYLHPCEQEGISFFPLVVEALGGWHQESAKIISKLARQLSAQTGGIYEEISKHLFQRLSILLVRGNSNLIITRMPTFVDARVDGDLDMDN